MRQAGQQDPRTFRRYCQPSNGGVDGQGTFLGRERREVVSDVFHELSIPYNPNLSQRLPAREEYYLEHSQEYIALEKEMASLMGNRDSESRDQLATLRRRHRVGLVFIVIHSSFCIIRFQRPHAVVRTFVLRHLCWDISHMLGLFVAGSCGTVELMAGTFVLRQLVLGHLYRNRHSSAGV